MRMIVEVYITEKQGCPTKDTVGERSEGLRNPKKSKSEVPIRKEWTATTEMYLKLLVSSSASNK